MHLGGDAADGARQLAADDRRHGRRRRALAVWYLPRAGPRAAATCSASRRSSIAPRCFARASSARGCTRLLLLLVLPALALLARALPGAGASPGGTRRVATALFAIAALNALLLGADHARLPGSRRGRPLRLHAVARGTRRETDQRSAGSPLLRWSSAENLALEDTSFLTDHQVGDTRAAVAVARRSAHTRRRCGALHPSRSDGGGYTTSAAHGPLYYLALAPAYLATQSRLGLLAADADAHRLGADRRAGRAVHVPARAASSPRGRPWLAVLAALLVAYEPMYGFVSGIVNNDVGVNATRGGAGAAADPAAAPRHHDPLGRADRGRADRCCRASRAPACSLYPVAGARVRSPRCGAITAAPTCCGWAALVLAAAGRRRARRRRCSSPAFAASASSGGRRRSVGDRHERQRRQRSAAPPARATSSYLWQVFLPRLPFMTRALPASRATRAS